MDGGSWEADDNVRIVDDDHEVIIIDPGQDAEAIAEPVGDRRLTADG